MKENATAKEAEAITDLLAAIQAELAESRKELAALRKLLEKVAALQDGIQQPEESQETDAGEAGQAERHAMTAYQAYRDYRRSQPAPLLLGKPAIPRLGARQKNEEERHAE